MYILQFVLCRHVPATQITAEDRAIVFPGEYLAPLALLAGSVTSHLSSEPSDNRLVWLLATSELQLPRATTHIAQALVDYCRREEQT